MCFEVPALVPPGGHANGNKTGSNDDDTNDDDLGIMDIDENDNKTGNLFFGVPSPSFHFKGYSSVRSTSSSSELCSQKFF